MALFWTMGHEEGDSVEDLKWSLTPVNLTWCSEMYYVPYKFQKAVFTISPWFQYFSIDPSHSSPITMRFGKKIFISPSPTSLQLCACISIVVKGNPDCTNLLICSVSFSFSSEVNKSWIILPPDGWQKGHHSSYIIIKAFCISVISHNQSLFPEWL